LAKFENTWDEHPKWVNLGAQKNFAKYAHRIGKEWEKGSDGFSEFYFRRAIARGLIFRATEKLVSSQPWYNGGYRANIVAYTIAVLSEITKRHKKSIDFLRIWNAQGINGTLEQALIVIAAAVNGDIVKPTHGISNISEWCKKDACWTRIQSEISSIEAELPGEFWSELVSLEDSTSEAKSAKKAQKIDNGIGDQRRVIGIPASEWKKLQLLLTSKRLLSPKEEGILSIAVQMPVKIPTEKQCAVLLDIIEKGRSEGMVIG
jgi:AIPR protein